MDPLKYLDLDLLIERADDHYRARIVQSPAGQASAEFVLPFTDDAVEILMLRATVAHRKILKLKTLEW